MRVASGVNSSFLLPLRLDQPPNMHHTQELMTLVLTFYGSLEWRVLASTAASKLLPAQSLKVSRAVDGSPLLHYQAIGSGAFSAALYPLSSV